MVISILGISGRDWSTKKPKPVYYECEVLGKENGAYLNSTDMLIKNYEDELYFLGTKEAILFQKELLDMDSEHIHFIEISHNNLDDIYEKVLELLEKSSDEVILDVTHGFRHQPISAIFAATFHRFMNHAKLRVIFAKEEVSSQKYSYIYLDDYLELSQLTFQLSGFLKTLNFVESTPVKGFDTSSFQNFSDALLSNDFTSLRKSHEKLIEVITLAKHNSKYKHLSHLFDGIEKDLNVFDTFDRKARHVQYLDVAGLMLEKNYFLLALTYMFETIRFYSSRAFHKYDLIDKALWKSNNYYKIQQPIMTFITQKTYRRYHKTAYDDYVDLYENNKVIFGKISTVYVAMRDLRNHLTHINPDATKSNIELTLRRLQGEIKEIISQDILKHIKITDHR